MFAERSGRPDVSQLTELSQPAELTGLPQLAELTALTGSVRSALETYSNVHRGTGHNSLVSTELYEQARRIVLDHLGLDARRWTVLFCSRRQAEQLTGQLGRQMDEPAGGPVVAGRCRVLSSHDLGLPLGLWAVAVPRRALPGGPPRQPGGGTARLVGQGWVVWAKAPERFEPGTPPVVNAITLARALQLGLGAPAARPAPARVPVEPDADEARRIAAEILHRDRLVDHAGAELLVELRKTLVGQRVPVPTVTGLKPFVNLDNAASTPTFEPIWDAVLQAWQQPEQVQRELVRQVRGICAEAVGAPLDEYDVIFTSNTTEAINLVAESVARQAGSGTSPGTGTSPGIGPVVVNTLLEHNSNELPWRGLPGGSLTCLPVDDEGFLDPAGLEAVLQAQDERADGAGRPVRLVAVSGASNVLGSCNDLAEIAGIVHRHGARLLVDAAQLVGHRPVDLDGWGIDYLAFSGHKVYAPFGTGVLVARRGLLAFDAAELDAIRTSGEENVTGITALGKALLLRQRIGPEVIQQEEQALTARMLAGMARIPGLTVFGIRDADAPRFGDRTGVVAFTVNKAMAPRVAADLAEQGAIGVRAGCHCAHMLVKRVLGISPGLQRFQRVLVSVIPRLELPGITRVSLGIENTADDVDALLDTLGAMARQRDGHGSAAEGRPLPRRRSGIRREIRAFAADVSGRVYGQPPG